MKKTLLTLILSLSLLLTACGAQTVTSAAENTAANTATNTETTQFETIPVTADHSTDDMAASDANNATVITLNGDSIATNSENVTVNGSTATITAAGEYVLTGSLTNGQIIVDSANAENVVLLLAGVDIHNESGSPIFVTNAEKVIITLVDDTQNNISDGATYANLDESGEPNAAIFSHDDLTINGTGALTVTANFNNGIQSKDDLKITGGNITVTAANDGIKGKDSVVVKDGVLAINAGADGIQTTNTDEMEKGYVSIEGGTLQISANDDAINAISDFSMDGGSLTLSAGDDGIHAETSLTINSGEINLTRSLEGLESSLITINGGNIRLVSSDDGINATSGNGGGQADSSYVYINGGTIFLDAGGDGLDSNGSFVMTGGTVIVNGPTQNNNGPLDYNGSFNISGGLLIAVGSSGMAEAPSETSTQYSVRHNFDSMLAAGTLIHIQDANGSDVLTFAPTKDFQSVVLSSAALQNGMTYTIYSGGTATGDVVDGLYTNSSYSPGTEMVSFTISSMVTSSGAAGGMMGRGGRGGSGGPPPGGMAPPNN